MTENTQELNEILELLTRATVSCERLWITVADHQLSVYEAKQAILAWHNKQVEAVIKKPHILPQNAQHLESVKQGINFYHRQMRKRVDKLKESSNE